MKICLRYLSDPGYQTGIGQELGVSQATVSRTVTAVIDSIVAQSNQWIKFPSTSSELMDAKHLWQSKYRFPTAIGVVDCTHIGILKPKRHGDEYVNRKGHPTLNMQATCDAREMFTSVDVSWPGSVRDSRIWRNSQIRVHLQNKKNVVLLADEGYGIEPWLMTPFRNPYSGPELNYNKLLKKERVIIERCFGQLKRRFPILQYVCRVKLEKVPKIIVACFVLHNVAKTLKDIDLEVTEEVIEEDDNDNGEIDVPLQQQGREIRRNLSIVINNFCN
ncbi:putative nuclease HARBI1 [Coccinella septempunctata]|uniref:putative nuclease HARBI1 n=1 Tax=Coccinella septempunctata TaxID=41139 RepID=UPI001D05E114|nr:putative nuclease HARBI1 [Coccinella septempunctata]